MQTFGLPRGSGGTVIPDALPDDPPADTPPDPGRRLVIEGNKAWRAAGEVRKRWLAQLFARRTAPREAARFTAGELLRMPDPLRTGLAAAPARELFSEITGQAAASWLQICDTTTAGRLPLLLLGPVITAYEQAMSDANTWRTDRYSPCPRRDASRYLTFLASVGYQLASIEQALADDVPYTGDSPAEIGSWRRQRPGAVSPCRAATTPLEKIPPVRTTGVAQILPPVMATGPTRIPRRTAARRNRATAPNRPLPDPAITRGRRHSAGGPFRSCAHRKE